MPWAVVLLAMSLAKYRDAKLLTAARSIVWLVVVEFVKALLTAKPMVNEDERR